MDESRTFAANLSDIAKSTSVTCSQRSTIDSLILKHTALHYSMKERLKKHFQDSEMKRAEHFEVTLVMRHLQ